MAPRRATSGTTLTKTSVLTSENCQTCSTGTLNLANESIERFKVLQWRLGQMKFDSDIISCTGYLHQVPEISCKFSHPERPEEKTFSWRTRLPSSETRTR